eukprot:m.204124 g.204124  ORF g.204124 m.204124 type:complete len:1015 (-) comp32878_c0_seq1:477-3521(-)
MMRWSNSGFLLLLLSTHLFSATPVMSEDCATLKEPGTVDVKADLCGHMASGLVKADLSATAEVCLSNNHFELQMSLANGVFGGGEGVDRDCSSFCVFNVMSETMSHFRWYSTLNCWTETSGKKCKGSSSNEKNFAVAKRAEFCSETVKDRRLDADVAPDVGCVSPVVLPLDNSAIDAVCPGGSGDIDRYDSLKACQDKDTFEIRIALANGMFGMDGTPQRDCTAKCLYSPLSSKSFKWLSQQGCWEHRKHFQWCTDSNGNEATNRQSAIAHKKTLCDLTLDEALMLPPTASPMGLVLPPTSSPHASVVEASDEVTDAGCIGVHPQLTRLRMDQLCSHDAACTSDDTCISSNGANRGPTAVGCNDEYTADVQVALANGLFGGAAGSARDCRSKCLYDFGGEYHYTWKNRKQCWKRFAGLGCSKVQGENNYAIERMTEFCSVDAATFFRVTIVEEAVEDVAPDLPCVQWRHANTPALVNELCGHALSTTCVQGESCASATGSELGFTARACSDDVTDSNNIQVSIANGLFGGADGDDRNCGAWCVFDFVRPANIVYKWDPIDKCWSKKQGNVQNCGGAAQMQYAVDRQARLCPPTQAPTLSPITSSPTWAPTTPEPTPAPVPSVSPTRNPSRVPSLSPSSYPTPDTTTSPSSPPTTTMPTLSPSSKPTTEPTPTPTHVPTTSLPTTSPSHAPSTSTPTLAPTTSSPSVSPTQQPVSSSPSSAPTISLPTFSPSSEPTTSTPTATPTFQPTWSKPTAPPTTLNPTQSPTLEPTTSTPTAVPTTQPTSSAPTAQPTTSTPTRFPTLQPTTSFPTTPPSTSNPTSSPTRKPTDTPTPSPSTSFPTSDPTVQPTVSPTVRPTDTPTPSPTLQPSASPVATPCLPYNLSYSVERTNELCPAIPCVGATCVNAKGADIGPTANACHDIDQLRLLQSLSNGMFGGADGEGRNCDTLCVWDSYFPNSRSYRYSKKEKCWKRKTKRCDSPVEERRYAAARYDTVCQDEIPSIEEYRAFYRKPDLD